MSTEPFTPSESTTDSRVHPRGRRRPIAILTIAGLVGVGLTGAALTGLIANPLAHHRAPSVSELSASSSSAGRLVKVVHPQKESAVPITVDQIALVEPYFRADLRARASGIVKNVFFEIGDKVKKGEVLIEIDVPELIQDVAKSEAMVLQRQQELKVSDAKLKDSKSAREVAAATIRQREADVQASTATRDLRKRRFDRFKELAGRGSIVGSVVDEEERDFLASEASVTAAKANVERARADFAESESKIEGALADIELKKAQIVVAQKELDRARAVADYAKVVAPFDGVIVRRQVDPGSFVQNATTGASEALISLARVDVVSVCAKFPDTVAASLTKDTPAIVQIDDLPDLTIGATISRFAPSVQNTDRTTRVEVDLFNGDEEEYKRLVESQKGAHHERMTKGLSDGLPTRAFPENAPQRRRLLPGMSASIKLVVGGFGESYVLPSSAIYSRSGTNYILLVENGKTRQAQVRVQLTDGKTSRVTLVTKKKAIDGTTREVLNELSGKEIVVAARQLEIGDGATVQVGDVP
jgi:multidrug efflux pump subunit AcrA (membrane-fusion protein)